VCSVLIASCKASDLLLKQFAGAVSANEVILHLMRCKGAMLVGEAVTSLQAPGFLHARDKLALFTTRILVSGYCLLECLIAANLQTICLMF